MTFWSIGACQIPSGSDAGAITELEGVVLWVCRLWFAFLWESTGKLVLVAHNRKPGRLWSPLPSWRRALPGCVLPFPQVHAGGAGPGDASSGSAEGPGLANIQRQAGLWRRHLCLRHPFNTREQTIVKVASRVVTGWRSFGEGPVRDKMFLVIWPGHFQLM